MPTKLIIDTDPGIDDAMAILSAFNWERIQVLGLTTLFGNVPVQLATQNALSLRDMAVKVDQTVKAVAVVKGSDHSFAGLEKHRIADFVHGSDGLGNRAPPKCEASPAPGSAADFIIEQVNRDPGNVVVLCLAAMTNVALALKKDPTIANKWARLVVLGGAFNVSGNVNPAAEANIFGDPEAAEFVLSRAKNMYMVGLDVTHTCLLTGDQLSSLKGQGHYGTFLSDISEYYLQYHRNFYAQDAVFVHDSAALIAAAQPELFTWHEGAVVVCTEGPLRGKTLLDVASKKWFGDNEWLKRPKVRVALQANSSAITELCLQLMTA